MKDDEPCNHPGCLHHITHPCEGCGRIGGRMNIFKSYVESEETDYSKYRGKCKQFVDELVAKDTSLRAVRGYYHCPIWGKQAHWWAEDKDGNIIDPTVKQFPTKGVAAEYEEFDGNIECAQCGKMTTEETAYFYGNYAFCSVRCCARFVGV